MRHTRPIRTRQLVTCLALVCGGAAVIRWASGPARTMSHAAPVSRVRFDVPEWAFPRPLPAPAVSADSVTLLHVPRSKAAFTEAQLRNQFAAPDWHPETHPTMPRVVARGRRPAVMACAFCHLPDGGGRPENAALAGLPAAYIVLQVADMKSRARQSAWRGPYRPSDLMRTVADSATTAEIADAARYFSRLPLRHRTRVVEAIEVPRTRPGLGLYFPEPGGGVEVLGERLIELPVDPSRHERRDAAVGYVAYVPPGSIARGHALATMQRPDGSPSCTSCHGPQLRGVGVVPPLAGRLPSYLLRQLIAFRTGARASPAGAPMRDAVAALGLGDMIAAAAYAGSREP